MKLPALPDHTWVYSPHARTLTFHLPLLAYWRGKRPRHRHGVDVRCGGRLLYYEASLNPPDHLDLCDECVLADVLEPTVYRFWDADDVLLYLGCTDNVIRRFHEHSRPLYKSSVWWPRQVRHTLTTYPTKAAAFIAETEAIDRERPLFAPSRKRAIRELAAA